MIFTWVGMHFRFGVFEDNIRYPRVEVDIQPTLDILQNIYYHAFMTKSAKTEKYIMKLSVFYCFF